MIVALTGGTGGAKLVEGLTAAVDPSQLTVICNTGDDCEFHGLHISPDLDTITYTLAGLIDSDKGWGIAGDTFSALEQLSRLGGETWFRLGDKDLATHITRTRLLRDGRKLSEISAQIGTSLGVGARILPMSDDRVETRVQTPAGELSFQEYFVKHRWGPDVIEVHFAGAERSRPAPGVLDAIERAEIIVVCPSNPITSIGPILAVPGIHPAIERARAQVIGVSPIIGTSAISGPAHRLMMASGWPASAVGVARFYRGLVSKLFIAAEDESLTAEIHRAGIETRCAEIRMNSRSDKLRLAAEVLASARK